MTPGIGDSLVRGLILVIAVIVSLVAARNTHAAESIRHVAGSYDILICNGPCTFDEQANVIVKGRIVLFANPLNQADLARFGENRLSHHHGEAINGCFTLDMVGKPSGDLAIERIGLTSWSEQGGAYRFSLFHSPDAGYSVVVQRTSKGLAGSGTAWGAGVAAPMHPTTQRVIARHTGSANISRCTLRTAEEHEERRLLADPARNDLFAIEDLYGRKLLAQLQTGTLPRDWAMAGWIQRTEAGEAQILRAREAAPDDSLIRWMTAVRTHADLVPVVQPEGASPGLALQYRELHGSALSDLQRLEPGNALWRLMTLRNAVDHADWVAGLRAS